MTDAADLGAHEPGRRFRLASNAYIRAALREAFPGVRVSQEAVETAAAELEAHLDLMIDRGRERYDREIVARRVHGVYPRGWLRGDHVCPERFGMATPNVEEHFRNGSRNTQGDNIPRGNGSGQPALSEVKHEEDAREVA